MGKIAGGYVILKKVLGGLCNSIFEVRELFKINCVLLQF